MMYIFFVKLYAKVLFFTNFAVQNLSYQKKAYG
jgi:hypothetical protein